MPAHRKDVLIGRHFGLLIVIAEAPSTRHGHAWFCRCHCGQETIILQANLLRGQKSCGCQQGPPRKHNLIGQRFGLLVVIAEAQKAWYNQRRWLCTCDCGQSTIATQPNLLFNHQGSCGCVKSAPILERFWTQVDRRGPDECWPWLGRKNRQGYGRFSIDHDHAVGAHRFAYELEFGLILFPDLQVCHRCDNPPCVNAHVHHFLGTARVNMADAMEKGRIAHGARNGNTILTAEQVVQIRALATIQSFAEIAPQFGVTPETISNIYHRRTWTRI